VKLPRGVAIEQNGRACNGPPLVDRRSVDGSAITLQLASMMIYGLLQPQPSLDLAEPGSHSKERFIGSTCTEPYESDCTLARHSGEVGLQLRDVEARCKVGVLRFRRQDRIRFIDAFVPPGPGCLLCIPPGQHGHTRLIVRNR
jgi:hypothetical protein